MGQENPREETAFLPSIRVIVIQAFLYFSGLAMVSTTNSWITLGNLTLSSSSFATSDPPPEGQSLLLSSASIKPFFEMAIVVGFLLRSLTCHLEKIDTYVCNNFHGEGALSGDLSQ